MLYADFYIEYNEKEIQGRTTNRKKQSTTLTADVNEYARDLRKLSLLLRIDFLKPQRAKESFR